MAPGRNSWAMGGILIDPKKRRLSQPERRQRVCLAVAIVATIGCVAVVGLLAFHLIVKGDGRNIPHNPVASTAVSRQLLGVAGGTKDV